MTYIALVGSRPETRSRKKTSNCDCNTKTRCHCETLMYNTRDYDDYENVSLFHQQKTYSEPDYINIYRHRRTYSDPALFVAVIGEYKRSKSSEYLHKSYSLGPKKKKKRVHW